MSNDEITRIFRRSGQPAVDNSQTTSIVNPRGLLESTGPVADPETKLFRPKSGHLQEFDGTRDGSQAFSIDPVAGWLAIVSGPGKGRSLCIGLGLNSIGRGKSNRIQLDFGDELISREVHASLTYDPKHRKYYIQHGGGSNLTYCNEVPVLQPTELFGRERLVLGASTLVFVPFCDLEFGWD